MAQFIVTLDGRPFAYLQCYRMSDRGHSSASSQFSAAD